MKLLKISILAILVVQVGLITTFSVETSTISQMALNSIFKIQIKLASYGKTLTILSGDTMLVQISDKSGWIKQQEIFHYGIKDSIEKEINGQFMRIKKWEVNHNGSAIDLFLVFHKDSNSHLFEIYFIDAPLKGLLKKIIKDLRLAKRIYFKNIRLFHQSELSFTVNSIAGSYSQWKINDTIVAICRAFDGIPNEIPKFENYQRFSNISSTFSLERNERMINMTVGAVNHMSLLKCQAGSAVRVHTIKVFHHPTKLFIKPKLKLVHPNTTFQCYVEDGYPASTIKWLLTEGPINSSNYYEISGKGSHLFIKNNCPNQSRWEFVCVLSHMIKNSSRTLVKAISFFVENNTIGQCNIDCMNVRLLEVEYSLKKINQLNSDEKNNRLDIIILKQKISSIRNHIYQFKMDFIVSIAQSKMEDRNLHERINLMKKETVLSNFLLSSMSPANESMMNQNRSDKSLNERYVPMNYIIRISKTITDIDSFKQSTLKIISKLSNEMSLIQKHLNVSIQKRLKHIMNNFPMNMNMIKLESRVAENISQIQRNFQTKYNLLKLENAVLKYRLDQLKSIDRELNNEMRLKITELEKKLETMAKERKSKNWKCTNYSHVGKIQTKGRNGEFHKWRIPEITNFKDNQYSSYSPTFYSYFWGYNMRIKLDREFLTNSSQGNLHLYFQLIPGDFDLHQRWPMNDTLELLLIGDTVVGESFPQRLLTNRSSSYSEIFQVPSCESLTFLKYKFTISKSFQKIYFLINDTFEVYFKIVKNIS